MKRLPYWNQLPDDSDSDETDFADIDTAAVLVAAFPADTAADYISSAVPASAGIAADSYTAHFAVADFVAVDFAAADTYMVDSADMNSEPAHSETVDLMAAPDLLAADIEADYTNCIAADHSVAGCTLVDCSVPDRSAADYIVAHCSAVDYPYYIVIDYPSELNPVFD